MTYAIVALLLGATAPSPQDVIARVDGTAITRADLAERLAVLKSRGRFPPPQQALEELVDEAVLAAEARRLGLDRDPAVVAEIEAQRRTLAATALEEQLGEAVKLTDAELRQLYHQSGDAVRLVLAKLETQELAAGALARVRQGGDLAAEARAGLDKPLAANGGDTGLVSRVELDPALGEAVFGAPVGAIVGPVELKLGWGIARVVEKIISDEAGFAQRRAALDAYARRRYAMQAKGHLLSRLKAKAKVTLDEKFLTALGTRMDASPAELDHVLAVVNGRKLLYRDLHPRLVALTGGRGGHLSGPKIKISFANDLVDALLFEDAAIEAKLHESPRVKATLPGIERNLLASAAIARQVGPHAGTGDPPVRKRIGELRAAAHIDVDAKKLAAFSYAQ